MGSATDIFNQAWQHHQAGRLVQAEHLYRQALVADPASADAWCFLGAACQAQGRLGEAEVNYRRALMLLPNHPSAPNCLGIVLALQGRLEDSARVYENLVTQPNADAEVFNNFGLVRFKQERYQEAMSLYRRALTLRPNFADALNNVGNVLADEMQLDDALVKFDEALRLKPVFPECRWNRATLLLLQGKFKEGWGEYESRWQQPGFELPAYSQPRWDGSALNGKTILLWGEQGIGDTLQFVRYAPLVKQRGGRVLVACQPALPRLLASAPGIDGVVSKETPPPTFDVYTPLLSLPRLLGTSLDNVPAAIPYLKIDDGLVERWKQQLGPSSGLRIGIAWQGNPTYRKDRHRSFALSCFAPVARRPAFSWSACKKAMVRISCVPWRGSSQCWTWKAGSAATRNLSAISRQSCKASTW